MKLLSPLLQCDSGDHCQSRGSCADISVTSLMNNKTQHPGVARSADADHLTSLGQWQARHRYGGETQ